MSDQDPTRYITGGEQWSLLLPARPRRQEVSTYPPLHPPSDISGDLADDATGATFGRLLLSSPPDSEATRLVGEALPAGAPGLTFPEVMASMPAGQGAAATLGALRALLEGGAAIRCHHEEQPATFHRPDLSSAVGRVFPPSRLEQGIKATLGRGTSSFPNPAAARRRALYDPIRAALPAGAPGITRQEIHRRIGADVAAEDVQEVLSDLALYGNITAHYYVGAPCTYHHREEGEQQ